MIWSLPRLLDARTHPQYPRGDENTYKDGEFRPTRLIHLGADPATGVALDPALLRHQLHGGIRDGIGCGQQHGIGGMDVPAGDAVRLVAEQGCDRRLVIAQIGTKTGAPVPEHMGCDVGWQIIRPDRRSCWVNSIPRILGRPAAPVVGSVAAPALNAIKVTAAKAMLASGTMTASEVARQVGCSSSTLYRHVPGGRTAVAESAISAAA